jgi:hypothetical protein
MSKYAGWIGWMLVGVGLLGCESGGQEPSTEVVDEADESDLTSAGSYVPILDYWKTGADQSRWIALRQSLNSAFDNICGDTFCGGDYSNLTSLGLDCSVSRKTGRVAQCVWTFAGSQQSINAKSGKVTVSAPSFQCRVATKATANAVLKALEVDPLYAIIPNTKTSLYDILGGCFGQPIGATALPDPGTGNFVEALDSFTTGEDQLAWIEATQALRGAFDNICGDTFCGGDYSNLASLRFTCSANQKTGALGSCAWVFGGSYTTVAASNGVISVNAKSPVCPVPVSGKAVDLAKALLAPGPQDALNRPLPGGTKSAYDALTGCL